MTNASQQMMVVSVMDDSDFEDEMASKPPMAPKTGATTLGVPARRMSVDSSVAGADEEIASLRQANLILHQQKVADTDKIERLQRTVADRQRALDDAFGQYERDLGARDVMHREEMEVALARHRDEVVVLREKVSAAEATLLAAQREARDRDAAAQSATDELASLREKVAVTERELREATSAHKQQLRQVQQDHDDEVKLAVAQARASGDRGALASDADDGASVQLAMARKEMRELQLKLAAAQQASGDAERRAAAAEKRAAEASAQAGVRASAVPDVPMYPDLRDTVAQLEAERESLRMQVIEARAQVHQMPVVSHAPPSPVPVYVPPSPNASMMSMDGELRAQRLLDQVSVLTTELASARTTSHADVLRVDRERAMAQDEVRKLESAVRAAEDRCATEERRRASAQADAEAASERLERTRAELRQREDEVARLRRECLQLRDSMGSDATVRQLQDDRARLEEQALFEREERERSQRERLTESSSLKREVETLQARLAQCKTDLSASRRDATSTHERVRTLDEHLRAERLAHMDNATRWQAEQKRLEAKLALAVSEATGDVDAAQTKAATLERRLGELRKAHEETQAELDAVRVRMTAAESERDAVRAEMDRERTRRVDWTDAQTHREADLQGKLQQALDELRSASEETHRARMEKAAAESERAMAMERMVGYEKRVTALEGELEARTEAAREYQAQLRAVEDRVSAARADGQRSSLDALEQVAELKGRAKALEDRNRTLEDRLGAAQVAASRDYDALAAERDRLAEELHAARLAPHVAPPAAAVSPVAVQTRPVPEASDSSESAKALETRKLALSECMQAKRSLEREVRDVRDEVARAQAVLCEERASHRDAVRDLEGKLAQAKQEQLGEASSEEVATLLASSLEHESLREARRVLEDRIDALELELKRRTDTLDLQVSEAERQKADAERTVALLMAGASDVDSVHRLQAEVDRLSARTHTLSMENRHMRATTESKVFEVRRRLGDVTVQRDVAQREAAHFRGLAERKPAAPVVDTAAVERAEAALERERQRSSMLVDQLSETRLEVADCNFAMAQAKDRLREAEEELERLRAARSPASKGSSDRVIQHLQQGKAIVEEQIMRQHASASDDSTMQPLSLSSIGSARWATPRSSTGGRTARSSISPMPMSVHSPMVAHSPLQRGHSLTLDRPGWSAIHQAAYAGDEVQLDAALQADGHAVNGVEAVQGRTALHFAAQHGHVACIDRLVRRGAMVDAGDGKGETALHLAALSGFGPAVRSLLGHGARVDAVDVNGMTAVHKAAANGRVDALRVLARHPGVNLDVGASDGRTPLYVATFYGEQACARVLIENGADVDAHDAELMTPLHRASFAGNVQALDMLVEAGASVNKQDTLGRTPLFWVAHNGYTSCVQVLLRAGADAGLANVNGSTPLIKAAANGHADVVAALLEAGADASLRDRSSMSALDHARQAQATRVIALLD